MYLCMYVCVSVSVCLGVGMLVFETHQKVQQTLPMSSACLYAKVIQGSSLNPPMLTS